MNFLRSLGLGLGALAAAFAGGLVVGVATTEIAPGPARAQIVQPLLIGGKGEDSVADDPPRPSDRPSLGRGVVRAPETSAIEAVMGSAVAIRSGTSYGSGVVVEPGLVLTAMHVIPRPDAVYTRLESGEWTIAEVVARDAATDLALLRVEEDDARPASIGRSGDVRVGEEVFSVGNPRQMAFSFSRGVVSTTRREVRGIGYIQSDIAANPGSSGSPLCNQHGELIGIVSFVLPEAQGLTFAIPIEYALVAFDEHLGQDPPAGAAATFRAPQR